MSANVVVALQSHFFGLLHTSSPRIPFLPCGLFSRSLTENLKQQSVWQLQTLRRARKPTVTCMEFEDPSRLIDSSDHDRYDLESIAEKAPREFVVSICPWIAKVVENCARGRDQAGISR